MNRLPLLALVALAACKPSAPTPAPPDSTVTPPAAPVNVAAWLARADSLAADTARLASDFDGAMAAQRAHAEALVPDLKDRCDGGLDLPGAGAITVHPLSETERFVTLACDGGAVLGNQTLVPVYVTLGAKPAARALDVPALHDSTLAQDPSVNGMLEMDGRGFAVTNRCCAGSEGTTSHYTIGADGALTLARVEAWTMNEAGAITRTTVRYPRP